MSTLRSLRTVTWFAIILIVTTALVTRDSISNPNDPTAPEIFVNDTVYAGDPVTGTATSCACPVTVEAYWLNDDDECVGTLPNSPDTSCIGGINSFNFATSDPPDEDRVKIIATDGEGRKTEKIVTVL